MKRNMKKIFKTLIAAVIISSMMATTVFGAAMTSTNTEKFRTAVVSQLALENGATANVVRGNQTVEMYQGMRLGSGDHLVTTGSATVYIMIDQDKILRMDGDSESVLSDTILGGKIKIELVKGSMFFNVVDKLPDDQSMEFTYENITISVRGTSSLMKITGGALGVAMADGTVEVTRKLPEGSKDANGQPAKEESFPVAAGQKFEYTEGLAEDGSQAVSKITNFTLKELPESIVEEMMKDAQLKERVVASVPESIGPGGAKYADPATVNLGSIGKSDEKAMEPSEEIKKNDPEIVKEEQEKQVSSGSQEEEEEDKDNTEYETCPGCGKSIVKGDSAHALLSCGEHYACKVAEEDVSKHTKSACGHCGADVAAEPEKHEKCSGCGEYVCNGEDHTKLACEEHYTCKVAAEDVSKHTKSVCGHCAADIEAEGEEDRLWHTEITGKTGDYYCQHKDDYFYCTICNQFAPVEDEWKHTLLNSANGCKHEVADLLEGDEWKLHFMVSCKDDSSQYGATAADLCQVTSGRTFNCVLCRQEYEATEEGFATFQENCMKYDEATGQFYCIENQEENYCDEDNINYIVNTVIDDIGDEELVDKMMKELGFCRTCSKCGEKFSIVDLDFHECSCGHYACEVKSEDAWMHFQLNPLEDSVKNHNRACYHNLCDVLKTPNEWKKHIRVHFNVYEQSGGSSYDDDLCSENCEFTDGEDFIWFDCPGCGTTIESRDELETYLSEHLVYLKSGDTRLPAGGEPGFYCKYKADSDLQASYHKCDDNDINAIGMCMYQGVFNGIVKSNMIQSDVSTWKDMIDFMYENENKAGELTGDDLTMYNRYKMYWDFGRNYYRKVKETYDKLLNYLGITIPEAVESSTMPTYTLKTAAVASPSDAPKSTASDDSTDNSAESTPIVPEDPVTTPVNQNTELTGVPAEETSKEEQN